MKGKWVSNTHCFKEAVRKLQWGERPIKPRVYVTCHTLAVILQQTLVDHGHLYTEISSW